MSLFDGIIKRNNATSPDKDKIAASRAESRRLREVKNLYEAAAVGRRTQHWRTSTLDANAEISAANTRVRSIARDMVRNNPYGVRAKKVIVNNTVGAGIIPRIESGSRAKNLILQHFDTTDIDADGRSNLYGLQATAMGAIVESGEVLIRRRVRFATDGYSLPFQLQILEADYLDETRNGPTDSGNIIISGIEFDVLGKRVAYWLYPQHPGSITTYSPSSFQSQRVDAKNICHVYRVDRPGQVRGISWFAPVILRMRDFADFTDAQLVRQKIAACFSAFITTSGDMGVSLEEHDVYPLESFEPGMIERLRDGEDVKFASPPSTQDFDSYSRVTLREIAVGMGITYEALTSDLTSVNYSSGRMGWLEFHRNIETWRWLMLMPQMMDVIAKWTNEALSLTTGSSVAAKFSWTPPRREMIDPTTEIGAAREAIRAGLTSRQEEIRKLGMDPDEVDREISEDNKRADDLELILDSDPRVTSQQGGLQGKALPKEPKPVVSNTSGNVDKKPATKNLKKI